MNKNTYIILGLVAMIAVGVGGYFYTLNNSRNQIPSATNQANNVDIREEIVGADSAMEKVDSSPFVREMAKDVETNPGYVDYTENYLSIYQGKTKVLFFHANWCPTCKAAQEDILENISQLPDDVVIIKTDYDTENQLKEKYGITYQHTFVVVDDQGNELNKWNGGAVDEISNNIKNYLN